MPAPHDLDPPTRTEDERLAARRADALIGYELHFTREDNTHMPAYDEDHNDPRQHCVHGTFVGSWWGPDYLCSWCEDGISVDDMHAILAAQRERHMARAMEAYDAMVATLAQHPYDTRVACALVEYVWWQAF
jgi:hypothetical protein